MSVYVTVTDRLALRCDGCRTTFHPRARALNVVSLRIRAARQGWRVAVSDDVQELDYCTRRCARAHETERDEHNT
jgi:hypothetical protein